jgi:hypothetical protein
MNECIQVLWEIQKKFSDLLYALKKLTFQKILFNFKLVYIGSMGGLKVEENLKI